MLRRLLSCAAFGLCLWLLAPAMPAAAARLSPVVFRGNIVLPEEVYRAVLNLPAKTEATQANAQRIGRELQTFLRRAGYDLAEVRAHLFHGQIVVDIDEGQLDKVVFLGSGVVETVRARLKFHLPEDVFNRPQVERELHDLAIRMHLRDFAYELAPAKSAGRSSLQLDDWGPLQELPWFRPAHAWELHILLEGDPWSVGVSPELQIDSPQGAGVGARLRGARLLFPDDRWEVRGLAAGQLRQGLEGSHRGTYLVLSRARAESRWFLPRWNGQGIVRPALLFGGDLFSRQRGDLNVEQFQELRVQAAAGISAEVSTHAVLAAGAGVERRNLLTLDVVGPVMPVVEMTPRAQTRPFAAWHANFTLDPDNLRRDQRHELSFGARWMGAGGGRSATVGFDAKYQKMIGFGWHDLWIESSAVFLSGDPLFSDEVSVGGPLRGPFGAVYTRKIVNLNLEYRYSLFRDSFKLGVFHNLAAFGSIDRSTGAEDPRAANAFGLGIHALLIEQFELDAYFGGGFTRGGRFDRGAALAIHQAF